MDFSDLFDFLVPCVLLFYGFKWLTDPPEFKSQKGLATKYAKLSEENWKMAHSFGGKLAIIYGVVMLALVIVTRFIGSEEFRSGITLAVIICNFALVIVYIPIVNLYLKAKTK